MNIDTLFDNGTYTVLGKENEVITAFGHINCRAAYVFAQNREVNKAALTKHGAEKIANIYDLAVKTGAPVIGVYDSDGAYVDGSAVTLKAYGILLGKVAKISGVVPQISVITGVCAGSAALLAQSADFVIMAKNAEFYHTPVFDNEKGGKASTALENGSISAVAPDESEAFYLTRKILDRLPQNNLDKQFPNPCETLTDFDQKDLVKSIADPASILELNIGYGKKATTSLVRIDGENVGLINVDGALCTQVCKKISRFVRTLDAFNIPLITLINTSGFSRDVNAEISGSIKTMAALANSYSEATTAKIAVVVGQGIGAAFTALTNTSDFTVAFEDAVISPLSSETYVEFLKREELKTSSKSDLILEYESTLASANSALLQGVVDIVIQPEDLRENLENLLFILESKREQKLPKKHSNLPF
ncbi:methylmalonyl-CoA carboxyltransferase [Clostridia bacterium]|nr:methylmalonyl-CoA carboxyltransferase [Clostridia bacterium]